MKTTWRVEAPQWALIAAMFGGAAVVWSSAPDMLPVHWGLSGEPDRWGGKVEALLGMPLVALGLYLALLVLPRLDPGRANYANFRTAYLLIRYAALLMLAAFYTATLLTALGWQIDMSRFSLSTIGVVFMALGGVMGKIRPNWLVGIRTPWTLSSKRSWVKTHRLGGWLFMALGLVFVLAAFVPALRLVPVVLVSASVVALVMYSYLEWRNDGERMSPAGTLPVDPR